MSDGGHVCLDWFDERGGSCEEGGGGNQGDPIVLILCGMTGQFYSYTHDKNSGKGLSRDRDDLSTKDRFVGPIVSLVQRFHCSVSNAQKAAIHNTMARTCKHIQ